MGGVAEARAAQDTGLDEEQVVSYLKENPDFLTRHPELLEHLELRHGAGAAVSLIERQVEILRGRSTRLESRLGQLLEAARENEKRAANVHTLARTLMRASTLAGIVTGLRRCLREDFDVDEVFVGLAPTAMKRQDIGELVRLDRQGPIAKAFDDFFRTRLIECGPLTEARARLLFPHVRTLPQSAAVVPLEKEKSLGMLVLASRDPQRFQPRQGRLFLDMTAELVSAALRSKL